MNNPTPDLALLLAAATGVDHATALRIVREVIARQRKGVTNE